MVKSNQEWAACDFTKKTPSQIYLLSHKAVIQVTFLTYIEPMFPFGTPWKHQKNLRFSDVFRGFQKGAFVQYGLTWKAWKVLSHINFLLFFIFFELNFQVARTFQNLSLKFQFFLFCFFLLLLEKQFVIHWGESKIAIHKCWKNSCWNYFQKPQQNTDI